MPFSHLMGGGDCGAVDLMPRNRYETKPTHTTYTRGFYRRHANAQVGASGRQTRLLNTVLTPSFACSTVRRTQKHA